MTTAAQRGKTAPDSGPSSESAAAGPRALWLLVVASIGVTFARAVPFDLQHSWDDDRFIVHNPLVQRISIANLQDIFSGAHLQAYHPLHLLSYWLDVPLFGANPIALHTTNLVLWMMVGALLLHLMRALGLSPMAAAVATLLCMLHPVQVEVVSWATGRKDVLVLGLACGAMLCHLRSDGVWGRWAWATRGLYALGLLAKTTLVPLPVALWLWDVCRNKRSAGRALTMQLPALAIAAAATPAVLRIWQENEMLRTTVGAASMAPLRFANTLEHQLFTALWPGSVAPMYASTPLIEITAWTFAAPLSIVGGFLWAHRTGRRDLQWALGAFVLLLLPVSNLVPMYFPLQDRYLSLPLLPLCFGVGAVLDGVTATGDAPGKSHGIVPAHVLGLLAVALLAGRSIQYQGVWESETRLWGHAASVQPRSYYGWVKLGETRRNAGHHDAAIRAYRMPLVLMPERKLGHAALLQAVALRDEAIFGITPSRAVYYAQRYHALMTSSNDLLTLAGHMLRTGHLRSVEIVAGRALALNDFPDDALRQAALTHFQAGRPSLGIFYTRQVHTPIEDPWLLDHLKRSRGLVTDLKLPYSQAVLER